MGAVKSSDKFCRFRITCSAKPKRQKWPPELLCPKNAKTNLTKSKKAKNIDLLFSSSFDALKKALVGVHKYIQATDASEASKESVEEKLSPLVVLKIRSAN